MSRRLTGKVALVSAGASGLGAAQATLYARERVGVIVGDLRGALGASVAGSVSSQGGKALFVQLDVTSMASWANAVARSAEAFGKLTTLVTNAGIFHPGGVKRKPRKVGPE